MQSFMFLSPCEQFWQYLTPGTYTIGRVDIRFVIMPLPIEGHFQDICIQIYQGHDL